MDIQADAIGSIMHCKFLLKELLPLLRIGNVIPEWDRWIAGIARHRLVVFPDQERWNGNCIQHNSKIDQPIPLYPDIFHCLL